MKASQLLGDIDEKDSCFGNEDGGHRECVPDDAAQVTMPVNLLRC